MTKVFLNHSRVYDLAGNFPGRVGMMRGPSRTRPSRGLPVVWDNDRFSAWAHGKKWDADAFYRMLDSDDLPEWVVVPDVVGDAALTFQEWEDWAEYLRSRGHTLALAVQDGMTPESVRKYTDPDVIFVGGTTAWKRKTMYRWTREFTRVHVGRINTERWLWRCHRIGVESTDGTGWFRGNQVQQRGLLRYLNRSSQNLGPLQAHFAFADCFTRPERELERY